MHVALAMIVLLAQTAPARGKATSSKAPAKGRVQKAPPKAEAPRPAAPPPLCDGDYADALPPEKANTIVGGAKEQFIFAVRNTATYEHVFYGRDGKLRRAYLRSIVHGTAFAYRVVNGETLLVTNEHVASQSDVTDDEHKVEGIPGGAKKVREQLKIVHDETDDYEPGHVALSKVLADPTADIAVLKAHRLLPLMPYRLGRSGALRAGNLVQVRGFPLGAFPALNTGKVLNPYTTDTERQWNHSDFVVDALLNSGNSGSPVFAVSCRTGEPELVGVFHAAYNEAAALNVVVGIDQLKEELETLKLPRRDPGVRAEVTAQDRDRVAKMLFEEPAKTLTFPFGGRSVVLQLTERGVIRFSVLDDDYPLVAQETLALIDRGHTGFGTLDAVAALTGGQPVEAPLQTLDGDVREHFERLYDSLWRQVLEVVDYRAKISRGRASADAFAEAQSARARLRRRTQEQKELLNICAFEADRANLPAARISSPAAVPVPPPVDSSTPVATHN